MKNVQQINLFESLIEEEDEMKEELVDDMDEIVDNNVEDENDQLNEDEDEDEDDVLIIGRKIDFNRSERRIRDLKSDEEDGLLDKQPYFQRNYVWNDKKASQLIESILLNVPIPLIYTAEDENTGAELVIDGQQRLTSAFRFMSGDFSLKGLKIFHELNEKYYSELEREYQLKISRYPLSVIKVSSDSDEEVKFEIFERINSGSANLNNQELRNCIYRGHYNEFIKEMAKNKLLHELLFNGKRTKRMEDSEMVLRFFAFYLNGVNNYPGTLKRFLNDHIKDFKNKFDQEKEDEREKLLGKYKKDFLNSLSVSKIVFGNKAFKSGTLKRKGDQHKLVWGRTTNKALFDIITTSFAQYTKHEIIPYSDSIREALINLMVSDEHFLSQDGTLSRANVRYRFNKWNGELQSIIGNKKSPRSFSYQLKEELFDKNPVCNYCDQKIHNLDDSVVDHHKPYWKGGETIPENARLMHRFCNLVKSGE